MKARGVVNTFLCSSLIDIGISVALLLLLFFFFFFFFFFASAVSDKSTEPRAQN